MGTKVGAVDSKVDTLRLELKADIKSVDKKIEKVRDSLGSQILDLVQRVAEIKGILRGLKIVDWEDSSYESTSTTTESEPQESLASIQR